MKGYGWKCVDPPRHLEEGPRKNLGLKTLRIDMHSNGARHIRISINFDNTASRNEYASA